MTQDISECGELLLKLRRIDVKFMVDWRWGDIEFMVELVVGDCIEYQLNKHGLLLQTATPHTNSSRSDRLFVLAQQGACLRGA